MFPQPSGHWLYLSNCLHLKRLSHWSCKFDFSPLCGLNVSSSRVYKRKQSRTGCICMTCMGWDKLSVIGVSTDLKIVQRSSSPTAKKTLPVIVRIYLFFFTAHVHVYPQIAFPRKFKVALVTQVWLFSTAHCPRCQVGCSGSKNLPAVTTGG